MGVEPRLQGDDVALRREDEDLLLEQVDLERLHELPRILELGLPLEHLAQPASARRSVLAARRPPCSASARRCRTPRCGASPRCGSGSRAGGPTGPMTVVCSDWYMLNLGMAT